jgi:hypothetical protein
MLLRFAKIAGGLRFLITEAAPLIATSVGLLSARSAAYFGGFALGSIVSSWLPIIALLISVTGFFNAGANTPECEAFRGQMRAIDQANKAALEAYKITLAPDLISNKKCSDSVTAYFQNAYKAAASRYASCPGPEFVFCVSIGCYDPGKYCREAIDKEIRDGAPTCPPPPPFPTLQTYPACSSPDCPPGKKVWTQVLWASPTGNFVDPKGCFIVAFSQDAPDLPINIEYNPFLPDDFVKSQAVSYYLVEGDKYRGLTDNDWQNLESVQGWDKGYWRSEFTDTECRGWRPGWSKQVK